VEWFSTLTLALGSAWTSGINLYATVSVLGLLQRLGGVKLPGGLYIIEFFADKIPYVDSVWDVVHTFIRVPAGAVVAYAAVADMDPAIVIPATLIGGGFAFASHGTKAAARMGANLSPEPVSNWTLSIVEDIIAFGGTFLAVFAPVVIAIVLAIFTILFLWFFPKIFRAIRRLFSGVKAFFNGEEMKEVARKAG